MKKLKSLLTLGLMLCAASQLQAQVHTETFQTFTPNQWDSQRITRDQVWEITGSSEMYCRAWSDGCFHEMMDGNTGTWWHSFYSVAEQGTGDNKCHVTDGSCPYHNQGVSRSDDNGTADYPHFFIVNLNKADETYRPWINAVKYTSRPKADTGTNQYSNGTCDAYKVYVVDEIPNIPLVDANNGNRQKLQQFITEHNLTPDASGNATLPKSTTTGGVTTINFPNPKQGHYIIFVLATTRGNDGNNNKYAHCAEFDVQTTELTEETIVTAVDLPEGPQVAINQTNGTVDGSVWTSTVTPGVKFIMGPGSGYDSFNDGWLKITPNGGPRTFTIESTDPAYYVKAFKFTAKNNESGTNAADFTLASATCQGECTENNDVLLYELDIEEGTAATFTIGCTNTQAKKLTLTDFYVVLAPITAQPEYPALDRTGWTVDGCSHYNHQNGSDDGSFSDIVDGNTNTYWHTEYNNDTAHSGHFFIVDMKRGKNVEGVGYLPRQDAGIHDNGFVRGAKVYVVDDVAGITCQQNGTSHTSINTFLSDKTPNYDGSVLCDHTVMGKTYYLPFKEMAMGRYIIFYITKTTGDNGNWTDGQNNHANCAELYVYGEEVDESVTIEVSSNENGSAWIGDDTNATSVYFDNAEAFSAVTLHAAPNEGYRFTNWTLNGTQVSNEVDYTISEYPGLGTHQYTANFTGLYATGFEGVTFVGNNKGGRRTKGLSISDDKGHTSVSTGALQTNSTATTHNDIVFDKTQTVCLTTEPGAIVTITPDAEGTWMHQYVYLDLQGDGFGYDDEKLTYVTYSGTKPLLKPNTDLQYFSYFEGYDSNGASQSNVGNYENPCSFTMPDLPAGTYRCRYKVDWDNLDPCGKDLAVNNGIIVDFLICIPNPKQGLYDAFKAEIENYIAAGFDESWVTGDTEHTAADAVADLETLLNNDAADETIFTAAINMKRDEILRNITPKGLVRIFNKASNANYPIALSSKGGEAVYHSGDTGEQAGIKFPNFLWSIEYRSQGKFALKNHHSQKYVGNAAHEDGHVAMSAEACDLELHFTSNGHFGLYTGENGYMAYPIGDANYLVGNHSANTAQWRLEHFAGAELEDGNNEGVELATKNTENGDVTVTFQAKEGVDLTVLEEAYYEPAHMRITVSGPRTNAPMRREASLAEGLKGTELDCKDGEYSFTIPAAALGNYTINVPAGFFSTNGDLTAAQSIGLSVKADGATTSISEVGVAEVAAEGIYDLQGRRLVAPVKGINIINGKKTLVK